MSKYLNVLDQVRIAAPCTAEWDAMHGNEQVRACEHCTRQVHNLSALTRRDALKLVAQSGGKLCLRYYQRPDGTPMLLSDKLYRIPHRVSGAAASLFGALLSLSATANANAAANLRPDTNAPHAAIARSLATHGPTGRDASDTKRPAISAVQGMMIMRRASIPLVKAASGNDLPEVAKLLASGLVNVNELDRATDMTALMEAVRNGNREMVLALLHAGAQVNQRSKENETALM